MVATHESPFFRRTILGMLHLYMNSNLLQTIDAPL
jgi:hypothetical protein